MTTAMDAAEHIRRRVGDLVGEPYTPPPMPEAPLPRRRAADDGILLKRWGDVHRNTDTDRTPCGKPVVNPIGATDNEVLIYNLVRCHECYPDWRRGPRC